MTAPHAGRLREFAKQIRGGLAVRLLWREMTATHCIDDRLAQELIHDALAPVEQTLADVLTARAAVLEEITQGETQP